MAFNIVSSSDADVSSNAKSSSGVIDHSTRGPGGNNLCVEASEKCQTVIDYVAEIPALLSVPRRLAGGQESNLGQDLASTTPKAKEGRNCRLVLVNQDGCKYDNRISFFFYGLLAVQVILST
jgi:hypothetical protein